MYYCRARIEQFPRRLIDLNTCHYPRNFLIQLVSRINKFYRSSSPTTSAQYLDLTCPHSCPSLSTHSVSLPLQTSTSAPVASCLTTAPRPKSRHSLARTTSATTPTHVQIKMVVDARLLVPLLQTSQHMHRTKGRRQLPVGCRYVQRGQCSCPQDISVNQVDAPNCQFPLNIH